MGAIEWSMWANEYAIASSLVMFLGGILAVCGKFKNWEIGIYAILKIIRIAGCFVFVLEYPRGKRKSGSTRQRKFQRPFTVIISYGRLLTRNYFIRFVLYLVMSVPGCFMLPTLLGAMCYIITSFIYLLSAVKGEEWLPVEPEERETGPKVIEEPQRPPPRRPVTSPRGENQV